MGDWQPMDTAPMDELVLLNFSFGIRLGSFDAINDASYPRIWRTPDGASLCRPWKDDEMPSHWMPLPSPPDQPGAQAGDRHDT